MPPTLQQQITQLDPEAAKAIDSYIDELKGEAQGDFDFVTKFLKRQFETSLGSNNVAKAEFFSKVANQLEKRIGRIPFDFDQKTGREKEDITNFLRRSSLEDTDLRAREVEFEKQEEFKQEVQTGQRKEEFSGRGLLGSGLEKKREQQQAEARKLETDPRRRAFELERSRRAEQVQEAGLQSGRRLEDIKTGARRAGEDTEAGFARGTESAERSLEQRLAGISRTGRTEQRNVLAGLQAEDIFKRQQAV